MKQTKYQEIDNVMSETLKQIFTSIDLNIMRKYVKPEVLAKYTQKEQRVIFSMSCRLGVPFESAAVLFREMEKE